MFGKTLWQYLGFQKALLGLTAAVGLARLGLSLAGWPDAAVAWLSMTAVSYAAAVYYGIAVHTRGFGGYKQLLPLALFQATLAHAIAVLGIRLAIAGLPNIYAAPEFSGPVTPQSQWLHLLAHVTVGMLAYPLMLWAVASVVLLATRRATRRPAVA